MEESSMKKDVCGQLPQEIFVPNESRDEGEVVNKGIVDFGQADFYCFLKQEDSSHDDHQILNDGGQTMAKRETILVVGHMELLISQISNVKVRISNKIQMSNFPVSIPRR